MSVLVSEEFPTSHGIFCIGYSLTSLGRAKNDQTFITYLKEHGPRLDLQLQHIV